MQPTIEQCYAKIEWTLTDKKAGGQRAKKLLDLCKKYGVDLDAVKIEQHNDYRWGYTAKNRFQIGGTNSTKTGRAIDKFWAVLPMDAVEKYEQKIKCPECGKHRCFHQTQEI